MAPGDPLILPYAGVSPSFAGPLLAAGAGSAVLGTVTFGRNGRLGALSVVRADGHFVKVGDDCSIGARSTLHINDGIYPCIIGDRVSVGKNACVHAATVGSDVVIADRVVILDGAVVGDNVALEAGSTVFPMRRLPGGFLYRGSPAAPVRELRAGEVDERRAAMIVEDERIARAADSSSDIHPSVFVAATASLKGRLAAAEGSSIWFSNDFDAGPASIVIGARTNIQDNTLIRATGEMGVRIGSDAAVGHNATIYDCLIGNEALIGIGSTVAVGTVIEDKVLLAAGARTEPGQLLSSGFLYAGTPAKKRIPLDAAKGALIRLIVEQYRDYSRNFQRLQREQFAADAKGMPVRHSQRPGDDPAPQKIADLDRR